MKRISKQYAESVCELGGLTLIRNEVFDKNKRPLYRYTVTDCNGNFLVRNYELRWIPGFVLDYIRNTKELKTPMWICENCRQINFTNQTCMECQHHK